MTLYVKSVNNAVVKYPYSLGDMIADNPTVSFAQPISAETAAEYDTFLVEEMPAPSYDHLTHKLVSTNPSFVGGVWVQTWAVVAMTPEEKTRYDDNLKAQNKNIAAQRLQETDWVDLGPVSDPMVLPHLVNVADFNSYRLALRAIAVNPPITIDPWPVKPEEIWVIE